MKIYAVVKLREAEAITNTFTVTPVEFDLDIMSFVLKHYTLAFYATATGAFSFVEKLHEAYSKVNDASSRVVISRFAGRLEEETYKRTSKLYDNSFVEEFSE